MTMVRLPTNYGIDMPNIDSINSEYGRRVIEILDRDVNDPTRIAFMKTERGKIYYNYLIGLRTT